MPDSESVRPGSVEPAAGDPAGAAKAALRARLLAARRSVPGQVRESAAVRVQSALADLLDRLDLGAGAAGGPGGTVAAYQPMPDEPGGPDLPAVLAGRLPPGWRLLLPVLLDDLDLDWTPYRPAGPGAPEPEPGWGSAPPAGSVPGPRVGVPAIAQASLVVVPAVAVDRRGVRLGRGGGSYDRALARVPAGTEVVALLYDGELVDRVPSEQHDQRVRAVITPVRGLVRLPG
jgi:5-formyltetrahydrofolate cyclo-ligase